MIPDETDRDTWMAARLGKVTASRIADLTAKTKSGWGASRANYMAQLIIERLTGEQANGYTNQAMQHGIDTEPQAISAYEFFMDVQVEPSPFVDHPDIAMSGASPDGLVGGKGLVEVKSPNSATHIETLLGQKVPEKYIKQVQWQMACTGRKWTDWVSFDDRLPPDLQFYRQRIDRDDKLIEELEGYVIEFLEELEGKLQKLEELGR